MGPLEDLDGCVSAAGLLYGLGLSILLSALNCLQKPCHLLLLLLVAFEAA
jgi:hypothetical protein